MTMPSYFASTFGGSKKLVSVFRLDEENIIKGKDLPNEIDDIKLDHVSFAYDNKMVVNDVNCVIPKGKTTAIIGQNGSGKSTLIKLIDRLYESNKGDIYYGTNKAKDVSLKSWRNEFAIVSQDAHLFSGSIKSNITYGLNRDASDKEINDAITKANLTDVVASHEEGLNYNIGIKGSHLSGGEQQRIAIARAIIKNPNYLILDEASANLDKKTEKEVIDSLKELMKNRTTIVIAHDYSAIENADNIIVLDHGAIKYSGTKDEILAKSNILQEMFNN